MAPQTKYRIIHIDMTIVDLQYLEQGGGGAPTDTLEMVKTAEQTERGIRRYSYASVPPLRLLIQMRSGQPVSSLTRGVFALCLIGWDDGWSKFVLPGQENQRHTKITVDEVLGDTWDDVVASRNDRLEVTELSEIVARVPRANAVDTSREALETRQVSLSPSDWDLITRYGRGDLSAGLRKVADFLRFAVTEDGPQR